MRKLSKYKSWQKWVLFILGTFLLALGCACMIQAELGVSTWDVLHTGLAAKFPISIGLGVIIIGMLLIGMKYQLDREWPQIGTFLNAILVGVFLNLILASGLLPDGGQLWLHILLLVVGILLMGFGSGMYVGSGIGAGPRDGFTLALAARLNWSIRLTRTVIEATALGCGWLLGGGPVFVGTFLAVVLIGPLIQSSLFFWRAQVAKLDEKATAAAAKTPMSS
ncbi:membrane protein [Alkalihalobacillus oceani]|uniref:Membrane protein n=1 Tax=Halalkalibacter oceani TaxID=1653776 RepID=A0A9X2DQ81_9BACI|nr:membrane protein [Halalkalibacter oceani]MCM3713875.1 membrane protein [Halalkalibacter oceani]